jgi:hypothetical protein
MARYQWQNIDVDVPDEGQIFRGDGPAGTNTGDSAFVRYGGTLYQIPKAQFTGNFESLSQINPSSEGLNYLTKGGTKTVFGDVSPFQRALTEGARQGEVITRGINPLNPQGTTVTSNLSGQLSQSASLAQQAGKFGVSPQTLQGYQTTQTPTGTFQGGQFTPGAIAPPVNPLPGQTQALQSSTGYQAPKTLDISSFSPEQKTAFNTAYNLGNKSFGVTGGTPPQGASTGIGGASGASSGGMGSLQGQYPGGLGGSDALSPTAEETNLRGQQTSLESQLRNLNQGQGVMNANLEDQPIALPFITGQQASVEKRYALQRGDVANQQLTVQQKLANELAKRQSSITISKAQLERETEKDKLASAERIATANRSPSDIYGSGSIGEYNFAKSQGYTGSFSQYQDQDANRKISIAKAGVGGLTPNQINSTVNSIAGAFDGEQIVKDFNTANASLNAIKSIGTKTGNPTDDMAFIYAFAKIMDPNSVVREGEYKTVQDYAQALVQKYALGIQRIYDNRNFLTQDAKEKMLSTLGQKVGSLKASYDQVAKEYQRQIDDAYAGKPRVITNYQVGTPSTTSPQKLSIQEAQGSIDEDIRSIGQSLGTREKLIEELLKDYGQYFSRDQIAKRVYTLIPDR